MKQEFEVRTGSPVSIPYKWETAPGKPIVEAVPEVESWLCPLRPPPGLRRVTKVPYVCRFDGFEPDPAVFDENSHLTVKILKKLNGLRRKSMIVGACFMPDASQVMHQSGRLFAMAEDLHHTSDVDDGVKSRSRPVTTARDQPSRAGPHSSVTPLDSSFSGPLDSASSARSSTAHKPSSYRTFEDGIKTCPGPCESAWHQPHGVTEAPICVPNKCQTRRPHTNLVPTFLRYSSPSHVSFKHLLFVSTFRKPSKTAKQFDIGP